MSFNFGDIAKAAADHVRGNGKEEESTALEGAELPDSASVSLMAHPVEDAEETLRHLSAAFHNRAVIKVYDGGMVELMWLHKGRLHKQKYLIGQVHSYNLEYRR